VLFIYIVLLIENQLAGKWTSVSR